MTNYKINQIIGDNVYGKFLPVNQSIRVADCIDITDCKDSPISSDSTLLTNMLRTRFAIISVSYYLNRFHYDNGKL